MAELKTAAPTNEPALGSTSLPAQEQRFATTHWSVVIAAARSDSPASAAALENLCRTYWYPVYAFVRRQGHSPEQAEDLTQDLFYQLIKKRSFAVADRDRGRFRCFLLGCVKNLLSQHWRKDQTLKSGAEFSFIPLHELRAETRYVAEPADPSSPDKLFERRWALTVLEQSMQRLKAEYGEAGKSDLFEALQVFLSGAKEATHSYAEVGARLGMSESATRQAAYRMRCRFGDLLKMEVAQTVASPAELEVEINHLYAILSG
jgi:RNA polymerase sigma-70 factor (ECF subfamily)